MQDQAKMKARGPRPSDQYRLDLNKLLESQYKHGIYTSGKKVVERLCAHFMKETTETGIQVDDIMAKKMQERIEELEDQIALMREEYQRGFNENKELRDRLAALSEHNSRLMKELMEIQEEYQTFAKAQNNQATLIKRL